jgi:hypothetical protein
LFAEGGGGQKLEPSVEAKFSLMRSQQRFLRKVIDGIHLKMERQERSFLEEKQRLDRRLGTVYE